jgi:hypothetical protein
VKAANGVQRFVDMQISKAVYAAGWDGTVVLEGATDGQWKVVRLPSVSPPSGADRASQLVGERVRDRGGRMTESKMVMTAVRLPPTLISRVDALVGALKGVDHAWERHPANVPREPIIRGLRNGSGRPNRPRGEGRAPA